MDTLITEQPSRIMRRIEQEQEQSIMSLPSPVSEASKVSSTSTAHGSPDKHTPTPVVTRTVPLKAHQLPFSAVSANFPKMNRSRITPRKIPLTSRSPNIRRIAAPLTGPAKESSADIDIYSRPTLKSAPKPSAQVTEAPPDTNFSDRSNLLRRPRNNRLSVPDKVVKTPRRPFAFAKTAQYTAKEEEKIGTLQKPVASNDEDTTSSLSPSAQKDTNKDIIRQSAPIAADISLPLNEGVSNTRLNQYLYKLIENLTTENEDLAARNSRLESENRELKQKQGTQEKSSTRSSSGTENGLVNNLQTKLGELDTECRELKQKLADYERTNQMQSSSDEISVKNNNSNKSVRFYNNVVGIQSPKTPGQVLGNITRTSNVTMAPLYEEIEELKKAVSSREIELETVRKERELKVHNQHKREIELHKLWIEYLKMNFERQSTVVGDLASQKQRYFDLLLILRNELIEIQDHLHSKGFKNFNYFPDVMVIPHANISNKPKKRPTLRATVLAIKFIHRTRFLYAEAKELVEFKKHIRNQYERIYSNKQIVG